MKICEAIYEILCAEKWSNFMLFQAFSAISRSY